MIKVFYLKLKFVIENSTTSLSLSLSLSLFFFFLWIREYSTILFMSYHFIDPNLIVPVLLLCPDMWKFSNYGEILNFAY